jgi:hypothetical protein
MEDNLLDQFEQVKGIIAELELDVAKAARGNSSASRRVRKVLRGVKAQIGAVVKSMLAHEKQAREDKKAFNKTEVVPTT